MPRVFDLDVLACPRCGGRLRVIATVRAPLAGQAILASRVAADAPFEFLMAPGRTRVRLVDPRGHVPEGPCWTSR